MAEKNGAAAITDDTKDKSRAEKKRDKKKKKREMKRLEKQESSNGGDSETGDDNSDATDGTVEVEEEEFDPSSAFVAVKKKIVDTSPAPNKNRKNSNSNILGPQMRRMIDDGHRHVEQDQYQEAAKIYTDIIKIHPGLYALYGNRSYCYERLGKYDLALQDANKALAMNSKCSVNHYRQASALVGLNKFGDAQTALIRVLKIDPKCMEAKKDLMLIKRLSESDRMSEFGSHNYDVWEDEADLLDDIYISDDDDIYEFMASIKDVADPLELDPTNPRKLKDLWLGNLSMDVTEQQIKTLFSKYGAVNQVTCFKGALNERQYAFVNFSDNLSPGKAMLALQGYLLGACEILIKFPIKKLSADAPCGIENRFGKKSKESTNPAPINGDECYFWRTRGHCYHENNCRYKHVKAHKGIDRAPIY